MHFNQLLLVTIARAIGLDKGDDMKNRHFTEPAIFLLCNALESLLKNKTGINRAEMHEKMLNNYIEFFNSVEEEDCKLYISRMKEAGISFQDQFKVMAVDAYRLYYAMVRNKVCGIEGGVITIEDEKIFLGEESSNLPLENGFDEDEEDLPELDDVYYRD